MNGTTESSFVLDTNAVIFLVKNANTVPAELQGKLVEGDWYISGITEIELFAKPSLPADEEKLIRTFLSDETEIIDLTPAVKAKTIEIRRATKLKLPDAIIAATAIVLDAILLTDDHHLIDLSWPGFRVQKII